MRTAPRDALLAEVSSPALRGRAFGFHRAMDHMGAVLGPLIASALFIALGRSYRLLFALASIPGLLTIVFTTLRVREPGAADSAVAARERETPPPSSADAAPRSGAFAGLIVAVFLFALGNSSDAFLLLRLEQAGVDVAYLPFLWSALHLVKVLSVYPCGILSDRVGRRPMILAGWLYYALVYVGFARIGSPLWLAATFVAYGLFYGLTEGAERALVGDLAGPERRGTAFGIYNAATGIGALPASVLMGGIWQTYGPHAGFLLGAALAGLAAVVLLATNPPPRLVVGVRPVPR
jgi:MFS family permease